MAASEEIERKYLQAARVMTAEDESSLVRVSDLIEQGQQLVVLIPYGKSRDQYDTLTERLIDTVERSNASVSVVQVGSTRPKGWRRWLARLNATRTLIVTPESLSDPTVAMFWAPEAETGIQRLVVGEMMTMRTGHRNA